MKKRKIVLGVCFFLLLAITIAMPIVDYLMNGFVSQNSITGSITLLIGDFLFLVRHVIVYTSGDKKTYAIYESKYGEIIGKAFVLPEQKRERKKLLCAIDLYNQNKFNKAIEKLNELFPKSELSCEKYAVLMFLGLCYTDMGANEMAIKTYEKLLSYDMSKSDAWSNLGYVYKRLGNFEKQVECYTQAISFDKSNPYAYNNLAQALFTQGLYEEAIPHATKALEIKANMHQSASCLSMCYCALGDDEKCEEYAKIAIANGTNENGLRELISRLRLARKYKEENEDE